MAVSIAELDGDHRDSGGLRGVDVYPRIADHESVARVAAGHLDRCGQMARVRLAEGKRILSAYRLEVAVEPKRAQESQRKRLGLVGADRHLESCIGESLDCFDRAGIGPR